MPFGSISGAIDLNSTIVKELHKIAGGYGFALNRSQLIINESSYNMVYVGNITHA